MPMLTKLVALFSGQGMANLVEFYSGGVANDHPDALVLIDFGGDPSDADDAVNYVKTKLEQQADNELALLVVSHQDADHHNLLGTLGNRLAATGVVYDIGYVFTGGAGWEKGSKDSVTGFCDGAQSAPTPDFSQPYRSDYLDPLASSPTLNELWSIGDVHVRVLASQVKRSGTGFKNASSAIVVIENTAASIVLPGDATHETMEKVNDIFDDWDDDPTLPRMQPVHAMEIPHHGALATAAQMKTKSKKRTRDITRLDNFAANLSARRVFVSAGPYNSYGHPSKTVIDVFAQNAMAWYAHDIVAMIYDTKPHGTPWRDAYEQIEVDQWIYTTVEDIDPVAYTYWPTNVEVEMTSAAVTLRARPLARILADPAAENEPESAQDRVVYAAAPPPGSPGDAAP